MDVYNDECSGHALFIFVNPFVDPLLRLSIRSLRFHKGKYLGLEGTWQSEPHFFSIQSLIGISWPRYRVGPEIVANIPYNDSIQVCSIDGKLQESAFWNLSPTQSGVANRVAAFSWTGSDVSPEADVQILPPPQPVPALTAETKSPQPRRVQTRQSIIVFALAAAGFTYSSYRCEIVGGCPEDVRVTSEIRQTPDLETVPMRFAEIAPPPMPTIPDAQIAVQALAIAQECAAITPCLADTCFTEYQQRFSVMLQSQPVDPALIQARATCLASRQPALPDGLYSAQAMASCGAPRQFAVPVSVQSGRIHWKHDFPLSGGAPATVHWNGTVDADGTIRAVAGSEHHVAAGRFKDAEREVEMRYPGCDRPVVLSISATRLE